METAPTVFVVDDDEGICRALRRLLESVGLAVETFGSADAFLNRDPRPQAGCLILDVRMPGMSGLELQSAMAARQITLPIVFVTAHADVPMSVQAMKAGAIDFIQKPFSEQILVDAVHRSLAKDAEARRRRADRESILSRFHRLTAREREVMALVVRGRLNKQIARELGASEKTVKVHRGRVMQKMEADSVADLVLQARAISIVGPNRTSAPPPGENPQT